METIMNGKNGKTLNLNELEQTVGGCIVLPGAELPSVYEVVDDVTGNTVTTCSDRMDAVSFCLDHGLRCTEISREKLNALYRKNPVVRA